MHPIRTHELTPADALPASTTVAHALGRLAGRPGGMLPVVAEDGLRVVDDVTIRRQQSTGGLETEIRNLAEQPAAPDEASARARLEADDTLAGAAFHSAPAGSGLLYRDVEPIRSAIVMAGGFGSRLSPLTDHTPKPLLAVGDRILLFRILDLLAAHRVRRVFLSIHHLGDQIRRAVGDGSAWGLDVEYLEEDRPLDTGAGLALLRGVSEPFFILNGDILTTLDLTALGRAHVLSGAGATMATYRYPSPLRYGAVRKDDDGAVQRIDEKPVYHYCINAGIYAFAPTVLDLVEHGQPLAMVDFLNARCGAGDLRSFPIVEYWNDVGTHEDFERAQQDVSSLS